VRLVLDDHFSADIELCLEKTFWRKGLGREALFLGIEYAFDRLNLHRVVAKCRPDNIAAVRIMEESNMRLEGVFQEDVIIRGEWRSSLLYAILKSDYMMDRNQPGVHRIRNRQSLHLKVWD
jgi:RimJ/RimL family protein N-acetyltransferase